MEDGAAESGETESGKSEPLKAVVTKRLMREGRWNSEVISERNRLMSHARGILGLGKEEAQDWCYSRLGEKYPPAPRPKRTRKLRSSGDETGTTAGQETDAEPAQADSDSAQKTPGIMGKIDHHEEEPPSIGIEGEQESRETEQESGRVEQRSGKADDGAGQEERAGGAERKLHSGRTQANRPPKSQLPTDAQADSVVVGLNKIPKHWPTLPPNASLASEIQWVQAVRIDVVEELPTGGTIVRLDRAERPAPSRAALGWLETSIRAYSKYCDIAARAAASYEDEQEIARRERMSIERCRRLLGEMVEERDRKRR
jgi:hypothetical protein